MFNLTPFASKHKITPQNKITIRFYKTFNNTKYTGAAQADITTAAVNVIVMSRTTHYLKYSHPDVHNTLIAASHLFLVNINEPSTV